MRGYCERLAAFGRVVPFDYPYMALGRRRPNPLPRLIEAHRAALLGARQGHEGPIVLAGKSMGGRVGCHLAGQEHVDALVCFGYPLVGSGKRRPVRDAVLRSLATPILFLQGSRDPLCPLDRLEAVRATMNAPSTLHVVDGGNHSLVVGTRALHAAGLTQAAVDEAVTAEVGRFLAEHLSRS